MDDIVFEPVVNIALLGGAFDPIGIHHVWMAEEIRRQLNMPTWVMPCWGHRSSKNSRLASPEDRWCMVYMTATEQGKLTPCYWEIKHEHTGSMYETVQSLKAFYPEVKFHIVIGMDNAEVIETEWDRGSLLIRENPFIVFDRPGPQTASWFRQKPHRFLPFDHNLSSTAIRLAVEQGSYEFVRAHVSPGVWEYIKAHRLYGYKGEED